MKIPIRVKSKAREASVQRNEDGSLTVAVKASPTKGKANDAVIKVLSVYFKIPQSNITIIQGNTTKHKVVEVEM